LMAHFVADAQSPVSFLLSVLLTHREQALMEVCLILPFVRDISF
jgi:hypothetical protein